MRRSVVKVVVVAVVVTLGWLAQLPSASLGSDTQLRARFSFTATQLDSVPTHGTQDLRTVAESHRNISAWLSAVGAAVSLADLDGNGREDDTCLVDPRTDSITAAPAPDTLARYQPFALTVDDLPYDDTRMAPMGCLPLDLNADGRMDVLTYYWGRSPVAFLRTATGARLADDAFVEREVAKTAADWATDSIAAADVDGDGALDLVVGNYFPDDSGLLASSGSATRHMEMHSSMSDAKNGGGARVLLQDSATSGADPDVTYTEAIGAIPERAASRWSLAIGVQDLNDDLLPEIYLSNDFGPDSLLVNHSTPGKPAFSVARGDRSPTIPKSKTLGYDSFKGMGVDFADMNGDGRTDMFVSNLTSRLNLVESNNAFIRTRDDLSPTSEHAPFVDESEDLGLSRSGWSWDVKFGDFDNDTTQELLQAAGFVRGQHNRWPQLQELALANDLISPHADLWPTFGAGSDISGDEPNLFWVLGTNRIWGDAAAEIGVVQAAPSRGFATADVDGDGHLDFAVANQWADSFFYRNDCTRCGESLTVSVLRAGIGRAPTPAYGAELAVTLPDGRVLSAQVDAGNGHASARGNHLHFGLGDVSAGTELPVTVSWRSATGSRETYDATLTPGHHALTLPAEEDR